MRIPRYLHRASIPVLILLTGIHLHSNAHSFLLPTVFLSVAAIGLFIENPRLTLIGWISDREGNAINSNNNYNNNLYVPSRSVPPTRGQFALSLIRATTYAFIGDVTAAYLLYGSGIGETTPTVTANPLAAIKPNNANNANNSISLTSIEYAQLVLGGTMWLLGALLWIMEPLMYWIAWRYQLDYDFDTSVRMEEGFDPLDFDDTTQGNSIVWEVIPGHTPTQTPTSTQRLTEKS